MFRTFRNWLITRRIEKLHNRIADEIEAVRLLEWVSDPNMTERIGQKIRRIDDMQREARNLTGILHGNPPYLQR